MYRFGMVNQGSVALTKALDDQRSLRRKLAWRCDVSMQTVRNWETGACLPNARNRPIISKEIGIGEALWDKAPRGVREEAA